MEPVSFSEMLKQFGPYGVCLFLMGSGLIYLMRWLREDRKQTDITHEGIRVQFLGQLKEQRMDHLTSLKQVTDDFKGAIGETHHRLDALTDKVETLDDHLQELRRG